MKIQCILADDEPLARRGLENYIADVPFLEVVASCSNALEVIDTLADKKADLLFLDIQMPKMTGMQLLKNTPNLPLTIITTAFPNYALEGYQFSVIDYLLKPVAFERFVKAANKAKEYLDATKNKELHKTDQVDYCFIKCEKVYEKLFYADIVFVEAMLNYVIIHAAGKRHISYLTLKAMEDQLPGSDFIKISKSFIVNIHKISRIDGNELVIGETPFQIGRAYRDSVMDVLLKGKLLKR